MKKTTSEPTAIATVINKFKPTAIATVGLSKEEIKGCDIALSKYIDLMSPKFYAWYCRAWYRVGDQRFEQIAYQVRGRRDIREPARLFSKLIKEELSLNQGGTKGGAPRSL